MKTKNKGLMGVGTLIVFIAVILVAAVAATVLISTAVSLQQKGIETGMQAEDAVANGIETISIMGTDGSSGHDLEHFELYVRTLSGSGTINLNNTAIVVDTSQNAQTLSYGQTASTFPSDTTSYNLEYLKQGPDYEAGYLARGDVLKIRFNHHDVASAIASTGGIQENKRVRIKMISRVGMSAIVEFTTPDVITDKRITLWP